MLTQSEIDAIKQEAEKMFPVEMKHYSTGEHKGMMAMCDSNHYERKAYIQGRTEERQRAKVLLAALEKIKHNYPEWNPHKEKYDCQIEAEAAINTYNKNKPNDNRE